MRAKTKRRIAAIIVMLMALQMIMPAELINASVISQELLADSDNGPGNETDMLAEEAEETGLIGEETGSEALLEEAVTASEGIIEDTSDQLISPQTDDALSEPLQDMIAEDTFEADTAAAATGIKDVTVMLYCVGADLEGGNMSATLDICEIMEGIKKSGVKEPDVNFIVETGGVKTDKNGRNRSDVIKERGDTLGETYNSDLEDYKNLYSYLTKGDAETGFKGISWLKNERYEIYDNEVVKAVSQPTQPDRIMTSAENNVLWELAEFIKTTKADYPAKRYMLILWDHGGGPNGGLGCDERDEVEYPPTFQAWQIEPTMKEAGVTSRDRFSYINYDACLMGNLETALAWSPYADYFCGSEDLEPGNGDFYENWVSMLYKAADDQGNDFSKNAYVNSLMEEIGKKNVKDFYDWYTEVEDNGTKSLIKLSEAGSLASALAAYGKTLSDLFTVDPLESYYGIYVVRAYTQDFNGRDSGIVDLNDFVKNMSVYFETSIDTEKAKDSKIKNAVAKFKKAGEKVVACEAKAVLAHEETFQYDDYSLGGVTVYLPYLSQAKVTKNYINGYKDVKTTNQLKDYKTFISTFSAIKEAGAMVANNGTEQADIDAMLKALLDSYGAGGVYNSKLKTFPSEIMSHRIQEEGMKIFKSDGKYYYKRRDFTLVYDVYQAPLITAKGEDEKDHVRGLGYLRSGPMTESSDGYTVQELINYEEKKWFGFEKDGKYIPVSLHYVDSGGNRQNPGNPFTAKTDVQVPVLYDGGLYLLDVSFDENSNDGKVYGMWPFDYKARTYGRYINIEQFKSGEITILADFANALEGEDGYVFDEQEPQLHSLGTITLNADTKLKRGINLCGTGVNYASGLQNGNMRYFMRDLFGSFYFFDEIDEDIKVSLDSATGSKSAGETLKEGDLGLKFTGQKGDVYNDSKMDPSTYNYYIIDENGEKKKLILIDGVYYTEDGEQAYGPDTAADDTTVMLPDKGEMTALKPVTVNKDLKIIVEPGDLKTENLEKVDGATEDLEKYFNLKAGQLEVTIKVADKPQYTTQFINESKAGSKMARACYIEPVTYTGRNLLTTQSAGNGSKVIDLVLYSEDGSTLLKEGTDYTVTYRNNKNVPPENEKRNIPCLVIWGKGEYSGMKYLGLFTIKEADMKDVELSFDKKYVPLTSKGISLKTTASLPGGIKVPSNQYKLRYYIEGSEVSREQLAEKYLSENRMIPMTVRAEALANAKNIKTGSQTGQYPVSETIYVYPKNTGNLTVNLTNSNVSVKDGIGGEEFLKANFKNAGIGRDKFGIDDLQFLGVYYDNNFTRRVDGDALTVAGKCYIAVSLKPDKQAQYHNYTVKGLGINVKDGIRINRKDISLNQAEYKVNVERLGGRPVPVTLVFNKEFVWDKLTLTCSTRDGGSIVKTVSAGDMNNGKIVLDGIDNSAVGNYTIQISSAGKNTGNLKLNYKVIK